MTTEKKDFTPCDNCDKPATFNYQHEWKCYFVDDGDYNEDTEYRTPCPDGPDNMHLCNDCADEEFGGMESHADRLQGWKEENE